MLTENKRGNYSFLPGIAPYSAGVLAEPGFEIVHVRFTRYLPLQAGFDAIEAEFQKAGRPLQALCGLQLRSPKPFTFSGFNEFNASYVDVLRRWQILLGDVNPVARTNVAPGVNPPLQPSIYAFSYTIPSVQTRRTFVVAGAGELPEGSLDERDVVQRGDISAPGIREKARFVMGLMSARLSGLGVSSNDITVSDIYTIHDISPFLEEELLHGLGGGGVHGVTWHYSRPPIESIEFEMDLRGCVTEQVADY
jgi:hypothetical protein